MAKNNYGDRLQNSALAIKKERPASMREFAFGTNYCWSLINANCFKFTDNLTPIITSVKDNLNLFISHLVTSSSKTGIYLFFNNFSLKLNYEKV